MAVFNATASVQQNPSGGCWLEIQDLSNFPNDQVATHDQSMFDTFFKVRIDRPDGTTYTWSAQTGGNANTPPPSGSLFSAIYNFLPTDINGTYGVVLLSVPTFQAGETYSNVDSDVVYYNGDLWAADTAASTNTPAVGDPHWDLIDEPTLESGFPKYTGTDNAVISCLTAVNFMASIEDSLGENTIEVLDGCLGLSVEDESNYSANNNSGHALSDFTDYIRISVTRPDNSVNILSSVPGTDVDEAISAPSVGNSVYNFLFQEDIDEDGIYTVRMCVYPTWNILSNYVTSVLNVVYYNGIFYKAIAVNVGSQPDLNPLDWEVYEPTLDEEILTRYCREQKVVVLCLTINECNEQLLHKAFCEINNDFCNDDMLCKNYHFLQATKLDMIKQAMVYSVNRSAWNEVEQQMNLLRSICNCL
jgi:hypothetical protein